VSDVYTDEYLDEYSPAPTAPLDEYTDEYFDSYGGLTTEVSETTAPVVEMAFGYGPSDDVPEPGWVDVTEHVATDDTSVSVSTMQGRTEPGSGIAPGSVSLALENLHGRFDPRNIAGPYYGLLNIGTPVRVRVGVEGVSGASTRWRGFVSSGFPQQFTEQVAVVEVEGHDVFGVAAQGDAPMSALDAAIGLLEPDHWWVPNAQAWTDRVTGITGRHSGALTSFDSTAAGGEESWGLGDPDGWGTVDNPAGFIGLPDVDNSAVLAFSRIRLAQAETRASVTQVTPAPAVTLISQSNPTDPLNTAFEVVVHSTHIAVYSVSSTTFRSGETEIGALNLFNGRTHSVLVYAPLGTGDIRVFVDGRELVVDTDTTGGSYTVNRGPLYFGHSGPFADAWPYMGVIDPIVLWRNPDTADLPGMANELHSAATAAWAGDRLDQRTARLLTAFGLDPHLGMLDVSGVVTQNHYTQSGPIELWQTLEDTEQGRVWVDRRGQLRFAQRGWAWTDTVSTDVQMTFSDAPAVLDDGDAIEIGEDTILADSPFDLVNVADVTSETGRTQTATNLDSIAATGRRNAVSLTGLLHPSDAQSQAIADWLIYSQSTAPLRIQQIQFTADTELAVAFGRVVDIGWLVRLVKAAPTDCDGNPIGAPVDVSGHVIGIRNDWSHVQWTVTLWIDCTRAERDWFLAGTSPTDSPAHPAAF
jgi:hypothetical protein